MTSREVVVNKALSGAELKEILRRDFERLLDGEGFLSDYAAFGRVSYDLRLRLHMDNPQYPESVIDTASRPPAWNQAEAHPELTALESPPLKNPSAEAQSGGLEVSRSIDSPNAERLRHGLPVPVTVQQQDGTKIMQEVKYPPDPSLGEGDVRTTDVTHATRKDWGLPDIPEPSTAMPATVATLSDKCHCGHTRGQHALSGICTQCDSKIAPCNDYRDAHIPLPDKSAEKWPVVPT